MWPPKVPLRPALLPQSNTTCGPRELTTMPCQVACAARMACSASRRQGVRIKQASPLVYILRLPSSHAPWVMLLSPLMTILKQRTGSGLVKLHFATGQLAAHVHSSDAVQATCGGSSVYLTDGENTTALAAQDYVQRWTSVGSKGDGARRQGASLAFSSACGTQVRSRQHVHTSDIVQNAGSAWLCSS